VEAGLLQLQGLLDEALAAIELGEGAPHLVHQDRDEAMHERVFRAEKIRMAHGAAHDAPEHVAPALV
jgi:hypothetical protein